MFAWPLYLDTECFCMFFICLKICFARTKQSLPVLIYCDDTLANLLWTWRPPLPRKVVYVVCYEKIPCGRKKKGGCWKIHRTPAQQAFPWQHNSLWLKEPKASKLTQFHHLKDPLIYVYRQQHTARSVCVHALCPDISALISFLPIGNDLNKKKPWLDFLQLEGKHCFPHLNSVNELKQIYTALHNWLDVITWILNV